jgi:hypothetical protein
MPETQQDILTDIERRLEVLEKNAHPPVITVPAAEFEKVIHTQDSKLEALARRLTKIEGHQAQASDAQS